MQVWAGTIASFILLEIVWPLLTLPAGDWSLPYFRFQVVLGFIIGMLALLIGTFLPLWEGRHDFMAVIDWCLGRKTQARGMAHPQPALRLQACLSHSLLPRTGVHDLPS